jgi:hypothetical protein
MKKNQEVSDVTEVVRMMVRLVASNAEVDFDACVSVDQELVKCGVMGNGSCVEEGKVMAVVMMIKLSLTQAVHAIESMLMTSPRETHQTTLILKGYYSVTKGKVLLNK